MPIQVSEALAHRLEKNLSATTAPEATTSPTIAVEPRKPRKQSTTTRKTRSEVVAALFVGTRQGVRHQHYRKDNERIITLCGRERWWPIERGEMMDNGGEDCALCERACREGYKYAK